MSNTTIINLYGGPGTGKSTSAAYLFYLLKTKGINAELVREYVKDWAWEGRTPSVYDQLYFLGKQIRKESMLYGKCTALVTDSPVLQNAYYAAKTGPPIEAFYKQSEADGHRHLHVFLKRSKPYNPAGRYQTEAQAKECDGEITKLLMSMGVRFTTNDTDEQSLKDLVDFIIGP
jgi:nicotinamide riboside kinase